MIFAIDPNMNEAKQSIGLRRRVIFPLVATGVFTLMLGGFLVFHFEKEHSHDTVEYQSDAMRQHFQAMLSAKSQNMAADLWFMARNKAILQALRAQDRKALLALSSQPYQYLNTGHSITHLYFHDALRINLLRVHQPERYGDKINRYTALQAEKNRSLFSGLELGPLGTFTLRSVAPVIEGNELLGYIELGQEIDEVIHHARNIFGFEIYVLIDKTFLVRDAWETGMEMLGRESRWDLLTSAVIVSQSLPDIPESFLEKVVLSGSGAIAPIESDVVLNDRHYFTSVIPVKDAKGENVAKLVMMKDISETDRQLNDIVATVVVCALTIGLGVVFFFYNLLGRAETKMRKAKQQIIDDGIAKQAMQSRFIEQLQLKHEKLLASEERFEKISSAAQDAIISIDNHGNITFWNHAAEKIFGYSEDAAIGQSLHDLIMPERYRDVFQNAFATFQQSGEGGAVDKTTELYGRRKDGEEFPVELSLSSTKIDGKWTGIGILRDITERKKAQMEVERSLHIQRVLDTILNISLPSLSLKEVLYKALDAILSIPGFSLLNQGSIFLVAGDGQVLDMVVQRNLPESLNKFCGKLPFGKCLCGKAAAEREIIFSGHLDEGHEIHYEGMEPHGHYCIPIINEHSLLGVLNIYTPSGHPYDDEERSYLKTVADTLAIVIERKKSEEALVQLAHHDALTGLPNRTLFYDRLRQTQAWAHRNSRKFIIFYLDLDHFKKINDTLGHDYGDNVLQEAARRLQACVKRKTDTIARMGGDEFTVILPDVGDIETAKTIAETIINSISQPIKLQDRVYYVGCSIGGALYPDHGEDYEALIKHADDAMYIAKKQRNAFSIYDALNREE